MENFADAKLRLLNELNQYYPKQVRDLFGRFYLYYLESTKEHNGGLLICKDQPANKDYKLATGEHIRRDKTVDQNFNALLPIINSLPILDI